jgi:superfamily II RNA helicase
MAGRAGRRGLDTIGNVVHCSNLFDLPPITTYKELLSGTPQRLTSKFKIYYPMILNVLSHKEKARMIDFVEFARCSMLQGEIELENRGLAAEIADLEVKVEAKDAGFAHLRTPREKLLEYVALTERLEYSANKKRKEVEMALRRMREEFQQLEKELGYNTEFVKMSKTLKTKQQQYVSGVDYVWKWQIHVSSSWD